ncbi:MAG TPA: MFS transporter [Ktedonobacteraceae bacterium]|jgi:MFS family permease|nr:MFS transporter [Ktedonobacteraceae bacterium]
MSSALWRIRDYVLLWSGQALSDIGGAVSELAFPLLVLSLTHAPVAAGFAAALRTLPAPFFGLFAGVLVDRWNRKRVMLWCDIGRALSLASIPIAFVLGYLTIWQLYLTALVEGTLLVLFKLAKTAAISEVVTEKQLAPAMAQEEFVEGTTALFGPPLSGFLYTLGQTLPFIADALSYGASILTLLLIRTPFQKERAASQRSLRTEVSEGFVWMWHQPFIRAMSLLSGATALVLPGSVLIVIILAQQQGASAFMIGVIFAAGGIGAILGSLAASFVGQRLTVGQSILLTRWFFALVWPLYAFAPYLFVLGALDFGIGLVDPIEDVAYFSYRLKLIPDELRGRVVSACRLFPGFMRPIGLALTGILIQRIGVFTTIICFWVALLLMAIYVASNLHIREARFV